MAAERRDILNAILPVLLGFALATTAGITSSYLVTRDSVNANTQQIASLSKYYTLLDQHLKDYQVLNNRTSILEIKVANMIIADDDFKLVLQKNTEMLEKVNNTIISVTTGYSKDIENINKRLDKAGL